MHKQQAVVVGQEKEEREQEIDKQDILKFVGAVKKQGKTMQF